MLGRAAVFSSLFALVFYPLVLGSVGIALGIICLLRREVGFGLLAVAIGAVALGFAVLGEGA